MVFSGMRLFFDDGFCILLALLLLTLPLHWAAAVLLAAFAHEMGHFLAVWLLGGTVSSVELSLRGAKMHAPPLSPGKQLLALLAGPAVSFLMLALYSVFPQLSFCGLIHGMYNLLPVGSLDGGNALRCIRALWRNSRVREALISPARAGGGENCFRAWKGK